MADEAPIHDVSAVRIRFTPDLSEMDAFLSSLESRIDALRERMFAAPAGDAKTASGIPDAMPGMPASVPADVQAEFARELRRVGGRGAENDARGSEGSEGYLREISEKLGDISEKLDGILSKMQGQ